VSVALPAVTVLLAGELTQNETLSDAFIATKVANSPYPGYYSFGRNNSRPSRLETTFLPGIEQATLVLKKI
jgi:hypothetical protein